MTHVSILAPHGSALWSSIAGLFNIFDRANDHAAEKGREQVFHVHLVGIARHADLYGGQLSARADLTLAEVGATDLVIVPALAGNIAEGIKENAAFIPWIREQYRGGAEIAGLCTGAFFLADTGLIGERHCSTHWFVEGAFRKEFSQMNLLAERIVLDEEAICSKGGAYSFIRLLLDRVAGGEVASACAAVFEAAFNRECQSVVTIAGTQKRRASRITKQNPPTHSLEEYMKVPEAIAGLNGPGEISASIRERRADYRANSTTFRKLFRKISGIDKSYNHG
jgi:transcriptional regulator GlxA family with amidase domain